VTASTRERGVTVMLTPAATRAGAAATASNNRIYPLDKILCTIILNVKERNSVQKSPDSSLHVDSHRNIASKSVHFHQKLVGVEVIQRGYI
jgi:hypothetical protein